MRPLRARPLAAILLSATLTGFSPGNEAWAAVARVLVRPQKISLPATLGLRHGSPFSLAPARLPLTPLSPALTPASSRDLGRAPVLAPAAFAAQAAAPEDSAGSQATAPAQPRSDTGGQASVLAGQLAPEFAALRRLSWGDYEVSGSIGRRIMDIVLGQYGVAAMDADLVRAAVAPVAAQPSLAPASHDKAILSDLRLNPPTALLIDYDGTLTILGPDGISIPVTADLIAEIISILRAGTPVGIMSARTLDHAPPGTTIPFTLWDDLISKIPAGLRQGVFFSGRVGGELVLFDKKGAPVRILSGDWSAEETRAINASIAAALSELNIPERDIVRITVPGQGNIVFPKDDPRSAAFAQALARQFRDRGLAYPVLHNGNWAYFSKFDKGHGAWLLFAAMKTRGYAVTPESLLILGNEFKVPPGRPAGGDAAAALAFPKSRAVTVGDRPDDPLPGNVRRMEAQAAAGSLAVLAAVHEGLALQPVARAPLAGRPAVRLVMAALLGAALAYAASHAAAAAALGTAALAAIGLPQIAKNFRQGRAAVKDLSLASNLIWFALAALLAAVSIANASSLWFVAANLAGLAESAIVIAQNVIYNGTPGAWIKALVPAAAVLAAAAATLAFPAALATPAFWTAIGLTLILNWPQIRQNYFLYQNEFRIPEGLSPLYPGLVFAGSLFHLLAALAQGDLFWIGSSAGIGLPVALVLGQIFLPRPSNALLAPFMRIFGSRRPHPDK